MLVLMDKSVREEHLSQPLQTNNEQFKTGVTFSTGYNGIFNVTNKKTNFFLAKSVTDKDGFFYINIPKTVYEIDSLNNVIKGLLIKKYISPKQIIRLQSNQTFQHSDL